MTSAYTYLPVFMRRQRDPRLALVAKQVRRRMPEVYGCLTLALGACAEHYQDGVFRAAEGSTHTAEQVFDSAAQWTGKVSLASALIDHGLLLRTPGGLKLDCWDADQAPAAARIEGERTRKAVARAAKHPRKSKDEAGTPPGRSLDAPATVRGQSADAPGTVRAKEVDQEEEREGRQQQQQGPPAPAPPVLALTLGQPADAPGPVSGTSQEAARTSADAPRTPLALVPPAPAQKPARSRAKAPSGDLTPTEAAVFAAWRETWALDAAWRMTTERRAVIAKRLADGHTEADLVDAVRGSKLDDWADRPKHKDLEQLLKAGNVARFAELHRRRAPTVRPLKACPVYGCREPVGARGGVWGVELCDGHAREAACESAGSKAWLEQRDLLPAPSTSPPLPGKPPADPSMPRSAPTAAHLEHA